MRSLGVDVGGTFTDLILYDQANGSLRRAKVPTTPQAPEDGVLAGLRALDVAAEDIDLFKHGTTLITNLIIERDGATVGLLTTKGHEDLLDIQLCYRDDPYNLQWESPPALVPGDFRVGIDERLDAQGEVLRDLDEAQVASGVAALLEKGADAIAICFLHAYRDGSHEQRAREIVRRVAPDLPVCISSEVDPLIREYHRLSTTVLNAYVMPRTRDYVRGLSARARTKADVLYMHSGGGALPAAIAAEFPVYLAESGPAGGVLGATFAGRVAGFDDLIGMDMGGTSCDISVITGGQHGRRNMIWVDWMLGARLQAIDVHSIGAGGGSIAWIDSGGHLRIGPRSAGADPGPACYQRGGEEPTVTDANLVLGLLNADYFLGGQFEVDADLASAAFARLAEQIGTGPVEGAEGVYRLVNANMAHAIREMTVEHGIDPRSYTLVPFGGAGGQHAAAVAEEIGIARVLFPSYASVLSAFGLATADVTYPVSRSLLGTLETLDAELVRSTYESLEARAVTGLREGGALNGTEPESEWAADVRYSGQTHELRVTVDAEGDLIDGMRASFMAEHESRYRTTWDDPIELVNLHVVATSRLPKPDLPPLAAGEQDAKIGERRTHLAPDPVPVYRRSELSSVDAIAAPAIIEDVDSTIWIPPGWRTSVDSHGQILIERDAGA